MATSRDKLLSDPRSGARPLGGSDPAPAGRPAPRPAAARPRPGPGTSAPPSRKSPGPAGHTPRRPAAPRGPRSTGVIPSTDLRAAELHRTGKRPLTGKARREAEAGGFAPRKPISGRKAYGRGKKGLSLVTHRSGSYSAKGMLTAELLAGVVIVVLRAVADYEPQADGTLKGKIGHPSGQYGPLPVLAGLIVTFFLLSFLAASGGTKAKLAVIFGGVVIASLALKSADEISTTAGTFATFGKARRPPGNWQTSGPQAGTAFASGTTGSSGGGSPAPTSPAPVPKSKSGSCPPGYSEYQGQCWPNLQGPPESM